MQFVWPPHICPPPADEEPTILVSLGNTVLYVCLRCTQNGNVGPPSPESKYNTRPSEMKQGWPLIWNDHLYLAYTYIYICVLYISCTCNVDPTDSQCPLTWCSNVSLDELPIVFMIINLRFYSKVDPMVIICVQT